MTAQPSSRFEHLRATSEGDVLVLTLLDAELSADEVVHALRVELLAAINDAEVSKVVLDLQNVHYLGSVAIRPFLLLKQKLEERGGRVLLCGLAPMLSEVFRVTRLIEQGKGLPGIFDNVSDVQTAVARLRS
jgi:anti-anti-sigma factor